MKKLIPEGVLEKFCPDFLKNRQSKTRASPRETESGRHFSFILREFFRNNPPEMVRYFTFMVSQCWQLHDCKIKAEVSDKEVVAFLEELHVLMVAAYDYHQELNETQKHKNGGLHA